MGLTEIGVCFLFNCTVSGYHSWQARKRSSEAKEEQKRRELEAKKTMVRNVVQRMGGYVPGKEGLSAAIFRIYAVYICPTTCGKLKKLMHLETVLPGKDAYRNQAAVGPDECAEENLVEQASSAMVDGMSSTCASSRTPIRWKSSASAQMPIWISHWWTVPTMP